MLFVKAINLCTAVLLAFTSYAQSEEDDSSQSKTTEEAGSLLKFITENASSVSLIKEIADALQREEADVGRMQFKKSLRWGDAAYEVTEASSTSRSQPYPTEKPKPKPLGEQNAQPHVIFNSNDVFNNMNSLYHPKDVEKQPPYPPFTDFTLPPAKDVVENYVDHVLTHQNVPALLLHVSLGGLQQNEKTLLLSFPVNVNFNDDKKGNINKEWISSTNIGNPRPTLPLRSVRGASEEKDINIAKAIVDKIKKSKPGRMLFTDLENRNKTVSQ